MARTDAAMDAKLAALEKAAAREEATAKTAAAKVIADKAAADAATAAVVAAGGSSTDRANRLPGETAAQANARITQAYKDQPKPELTVEGAKAGATIEFVRTAAGGVGTYKEVFPIGVPIPINRTTTSGNVYDAQGKLVSGTGLKTITLKPGDPGYVAPDGNGDGATYAGSGTAANPFTLNGKPFNGTYGGKKYVNGIAFTEVNPFPTEVTETGRVTNPDGTITVTYSDKTTKIITAIPGSGDGALGSDKTLASNVFKNTLALFFGAEEMTKPWVDQLYKSVSGFYKTGSTVEEAFNMAILEVQNNPSMTEFTKRFKGIYSLQKMKQMGKAVTVPTIAEYFATESKMGDMLKASNLGEIANEDFLGDVLGKGVSATEFGNRITQIFDRIDYAPQAIKTTLNRFFPYLDRISLAKALALGDKGALQLQQEVAGYEVLAAGESQGLGVSAENPMGLTVARASDIAKSGGTYASTLGQFGQIKKAMPIVSSLEQISNKTDRLGQVGLEKALIGKSAKELTVLEQLTAEEEARYLARSGSIGPRGLASQTRGSGGYF